MTPPPKGTPEYDAWYQKVTASSFKKGQIPHNKGVLQSEEHRAKLSATRKGRVPWNKGKPVSDEERAHLRTIRLGRKDSPETRTKKSAAHKVRYVDGYTMPEEARKKVGEVHRAKDVSPETRAKISAAQKGRVSNRKGAIISEETRKKQAEAGRKRWERKSAEEKAKHAEALQKGACDITNSWIENAYAQRLDAQGILYERQKRIGWYRVDFYLPAENRIIEINGCYWHACELCLLKGMNAIDNYEQKREKDEKRYAYLRRKGYSVEVVWEHTLPRKR